MGWARLKVYRLRDSKTNEQCSERWHFTYDLCESERRRLEKKGIVAVPVAEWLQAWKTA